VARDRQQQRTQQQQRSKVKLTQEATRAMKQYFEQCKKTNQVREMKKIYKPLVKKKESSNKLTMAQQHNEACRRREEHQSRNRAKCKEEKENMKM